jgi:hypothetical protein
MLHPSLSDPNDCILHTFFESTHPYRYGWFDLNVLGVPGSQFRIMDNKTKCASVDAMKNLLQLQLVTELLLVLENGHSLGGGRFDRDSFYGTRCKIQGHGSRQQLSAIQIAI